MPNRVGQNENPKEDRFLKVAKHDARSVEVERVNSQAAAAFPAATGALPKHVRQLVRRHAPALIGDRDRDANAILHRGDPDRIEDDSGVC